MNILLRRWKLGDLDNLIIFANNINIAKYMNDQFPHPYSIENGKAFIAFANEENSHLFAIDLEGKAIGGIGLHLQTLIHRRNAELGYWLAEPYWRKGIMQNAIAQIVEYGFATLDIDRIFARPFGTNIASQKVLEKSGFVLEAKIEKTIYKLGETVDELIYGIRRCDLQQAISSTSISSYHINS